MSCLHNAIHHCYPIVSSSRVTRALAVRPTPDVVPFARIVAAVSPLAALSKARGTLTVSRCAIKRNVGGLPHYVITTRVVVQVDFYATHFLTQLYALLCNV